MSAERSFASAVHAVASVRSVQASPHCSLCAGTSAKARKALESEAPRRRGRLALGACPDTVRRRQSLGCLHAPLASWLLNYALPRLP